MKLLIMTIFSISFVLLLVFATLMFCKLDYFNNNHYDDPSKEVFLSFNNFKTYYNLNPDRYVIDYDSDGDLLSLRMIETEYRRSKFKIKFKYFSFIRFWFWCKYKYKRYEDDQKMREFLSYVQNDIDKIRKKQKKKLEKQKRLQEKL